MSKRRKTKPGRICVYCGSSQGATDDHVPPKNLFPGPKPSDMITVPCCEPCRKPTPKDDEYFRLKVGMCDAAKDHPDAKAAQAAIVRSLQRPEAGGLAKMALGDLRRVETRSPLGLFAGQAIASIVDTRRIHRVVSRTVKGLFWHETGGRRLEDGYDVEVVEKETLDLGRPDVLQKLHDTIALPLSRRPQRVIGNAVFSYRCHIADDTSVSMWSLVFYGEKWFIALTGPRRSVLQA
jgi:hypothetical protein